MRIPTEKFIIDLLKTGEGLHLEMKACGDSLPSSIWETYSAFANTRGGVILLGISEDKRDRLSTGSRFNVTGVNDPNKIVTDFFNLINNPQKVNRNILVDSDVRIVTVENKNVVYISVNEADYRQKPIYINNNLQSGTYKRVHEGDRHVTNEELSLLIRDSSDDNDRQIIEHYGLQDIDKEALNSYRQNFKDLNPEHPFNSLTDKEFLIRIGGYSVNRHKEKEGLTLAGLLMFGKGHSIHENFPDFRLDYVNLMCISPNTHKKWNDRLTDDGRWEDNLYNFLFLTLQKLLLTLPNEGKLEGVIRKDGGNLHQAVREALVNCITYTDYKLGGVLRIDRKDESILMRNPGTLRISPERIYEGDFTQARNATIQKMFRLIGLGDNIGSGFQKIMAACREFGFQKPIIKEDDELKEVWLIFSLQKESDRKTGQNDPKTYRTDPKTDPKTDQSDQKSDLTDPKISRTDPKTDPKTDQSDQKTDLTDPKISQNDQKVDQKTAHSDQKTDLKIKILNLLKENPKVGYSKIANILGIHESAAKRYLSSLKKQGKIRRIGPANGGTWIIIQ